VVLLTLILALVPPVLADGWKASLNYVQYGSWQQALTAQISKQLDVGNLKAAYREINEGENLNLELTAKSWGIKLATGNYISDGQQSFTLEWPNHKATIIPTPVNQLFHAFINQNIGKALVQADYMVKDSVSQWEVHIGAEW